MPEKIKDEFVSYEKRNYQVKLGKVIASSLSGFLAGIIVTLIVIMTFFDLVFKHVVILD